MQARIDAKHEATDAAWQGGVFSYWAADAKALPARGWTPAPGPVGR